MGKLEKLLLKILTGTSDNNIPFKQLCQVLLSTGQKAESLREVSSIEFKVKEGMTKEV
jgi:hypothetical protein